MERLERSDFLWSLQYACDIAREAGKPELADEIARSGEDPDEDLEKIFATAQLLALGLQVRKLRLGMSPAYLVDEVGLLR